MQNKKIASVTDPLGALVTARQAGDRITLVKNGEALFDLLITGIKGKSVTFSMLADENVNIVILPAGDFYKKNETN